MVLSRSTVPALCELMAKLFAETASLGPDPYIENHGRPESIKHHVDVFSWYAPLLRPGQVVLDWGCHYGPDSCLIRHVWGDAVQVHACDVWEETAFPVFRKFARPVYAKLTDPVQVPYADGMFDVVIASGVLEHVPMDYESLKQLYRVLKPEGLLVITYLPYFLSWSEWYRRVIRQTAYHQRLYRKNELAQLMKRTGFLPLEIRPHTHIPNSGHRSLWRTLRRVVAKLVSPPFRHSTLCCTARKVLSM